MDGYHDKCGEKIYIYTGTNKVGRDITRNRYYISIYIGGGHELHK